MLFLANLKDLDFKATSESLEVKLFPEKNIPWETDLWNNNNAVFSFPVKSPEGCITRNDMTALQQLEFWKIYADNWCEHKWHTHPKEGNSYPGQGQLCDQYG